jgi:hypothetical protein
METPSVFQYTCYVCQKICKDNSIYSAELDLTFCDDCEDKYIIRWDNMDFGTTTQPKCGICDVPQEDAYYSHGQLIEDVICQECLECWWYDSDIDAYRPRAFLFLQLCTKRLGY